MKLPVIKQLTQFIEENDQDYIVETIEVLENLNVEIIEIEKETRSKFYNDTKIIVGKYIKRRVCMGAHIIINVIAENSMIPA